MLVTHWSKNTLLRNLPGESKRAARPVPVKLCVWCVALILRSTQKTEIFTFHCSVGHISNWMDVHMRDTIQFNVINVFKSFIFVTFYI